MPPLLASDFIDHALELAQQAGAQNEVPVGAVIVKQGQMIASAHNQMREHKDPTAHAEILAIRRACQTLNTDRLIDCDLYITLEPCPMCLAAICNARIRRVYYGADDPKSGGINASLNILSSSALHHKPEIYDGFRQKACADILKQYFKSKR